MSSKKRRKPRRPAGVPVQPAPEVEQKDDAPEEQPTATDARARQYKDIAKLVDVETIPYTFWKQWGRARERNDYMFMYEMTEPGTPARELLGPAEDFPETCRRKLRPLPGMYRARLRLIRLEGPHVAHIIQLIGTEDRARREYVGERWFMLRGDAGWRIHRIDIASFKREERDPKSVSLADFPEAGPPADYAPPAAWTGEKKKKADDADAEAEADAETVDEADTVDHGGDGAGAETAEG